MSKKYEKKIKIIKAKKDNQEQDKENKSSEIDIRNISQQSIKKQKRGLKNIKKKMDKSSKIW